MLKGEVFNFTTKLLEYIDMYSQLTNAVAPVMSVAAISLLVLVLLSILSK